MHQPCADFVPSRSRGEPPENQRVRIQATQRHTRLPHTQPNENVSPHAEERIKQQEQEEGEEGMEDDDDGDDDAEAVAD